MVKKKINITWEVMQQTKSEHDSLESVAKWYEENMGDCCLCPECNKWSYIDDWKTSYCPLCGKIPWGE